MEENKLATIQEEVKENKVENDEIEKSVTEISNVKQMSPSKMVLRRFFRSKLSIIGLIIVVFLLIIGIVIEINKVTIPGEYAPIIIDWTKEAIKYILLAFSFFEILRGLFHLISPHPDTSIAHICNAILLAAASIAVCTYSPNAIIAIGAQTLIMSICMCIYEHLNNIKYYS